MLSANAASAIDLQTFDVDFYWLNDNFDHCERYCHIEHWHFDHYDNFNCWHKNFFDDIQCFAEKNKSIDDYRIDFV